MHVFEHFKNVLIRKMYACCCCFSQFFFNVRQKSSLHEKMQIRENRNEMKNQANQNINMLTLNGYQVYGKR